MNPPISSQRESAVDTTVQQDGGDTASQDGGSGNMSYLAGSRTYTEGLNQQAAQANENTQANASSATFLNSVADVGSFLGSYYRKMCIE